VIIPNPDGMQLQPWADAVVSALGQYSNCITPLVGNDWQSWGMMFLNDPSLSTLGPPNPYAFHDWVNWGQRLYDALGNASGAQSPLRFNRGIIDHNRNFLVDHFGNFISAH
jgi:hypothetical protein